MTREHFGNEYSTTLTDAITFNQTTIRVADASGFPPVQFRVRIGNEILRVYAALPDLQSFTVERGAEGTNPNAHAASSSVTLVLTRDALETFIKDGYTEIPWGAPDAPSLAFNTPLSSLDWEYDEVVRPHGFFFEMVDGEPRVGVSVDYEPKARWTPEGQLLHGDLIFEGDPYEGGSGAPDYPHGLYGAHRIRGDFTGESDAGPPNEQARTAFTTIHPSGYAVVAVHPTALTGFNKYSAFRAYDTPGYGIASGSYIEIGASYQKTWLQTMYRPAPSSPPGEIQPPALGRPFEIRYNNHVHMEFGVSDDNSNAIGIGIGRDPHPNVWSLSLYGGINVGPTITGAGNGSVYAEGTVLGTSVRWGPNYHRTELLTNFQGDVDSGFYWAAAATSPPVSGTFHVVATRKHDEARHGLLAIRDNGFGDIFVTADGWRDNLNNPRWVKLWNTGNLPGSLTGNGILDGPIGIGPGANLTGKVAGDFVVERSITLANEPGAGPGEFRSTHGWIVGDGTWHGLKKTGGAVLTPSYARAGGQTSSDGIRGAAWLSYGGYPGNPPEGFPDRKGYGDGGAIAVGWRLGPFSEIDGDPILAELIFNSAGATNFVWRSAIRVDQNGAVIFGRVDGTPPGPGEGGMVINGPLSMAGPLIIHKNTSGLPENVHLKIWQEGDGDALFEAVSANNDVRLALTAGASSFLVGVENAADEFVIVANGTTFPDSPPDRRTLRIGTAGGAAFGTAPSTNVGDLSLGRGLNVGSTVTGAANGEIRSLMYSPAVNNGSGMVYRQHVWASADASGKTNLNLGYNVYGQDEAALVRQDTTKPSWYMRMGEQDAFSILRAAPGAMSDWELLLTLDDEGNLVGNNLGTLLSFLNVGAALDAVLGEIRMVGSLYLAQNSLAPANDQQIMVEVPAGGRDYVPLFRAEDDGHWWFGGAGDDGTLEMRVGGPSGTWQVSNADGSLPILRTNNAGIMEARYSLSVGAFTGGDELAPNNWLYAYNGIRTGNGSLASPAYSFRGTAGSDHQKTGLFYLDAGVNIGVVSADGPTGLHRVALFAHPTSSIRSHLLPTLAPTEGPPPIAPYDLGGTGTTAWRAGYFWNGLLIGSQNTAEVPDRAQLRVISNGGYDDELDAYEPQVIAKFIDVGAIDPSDEAKPRTTYRAEIQIGGSGHPVDTLMRIGTTFQSTLLQGFENTDAYEGRPTFYFERNRGPVIWGVDGERHIHFSESGSVGIGNVTPTDNLGDLIVARGLTVGLTNAGLIQAGEIIGPAEGEILATSLTITGTFIVGTPSGGTTQFNSPIILQNNVKIRGRAAADIPADIESGTLWDLFWLGSDDELVIQGLPENRVHIKAMTNGPGTPTAVQALTVWPNAGVTIGSWGPSQPPGDSGLKIAGDFEIGGTFIVQDTTRFWANVYNDPTVPAIAAGMLGDDVGRIALLAGGTLVFGTGNGIWPGSIDHTTSGRLQVQEYLGVNLNPTYRLDVREQMADVFAGRIGNAAADGFGLAVFAGDTDSDIAFVVRKYNQRPDIGAHPSEDTADGLLTVYGSGMTGIAGGLFVQDPAQPDPILQADPGQIICENIIVRQDTRYGYGPGGSGQTEVGASGIVLGNNIPLQVREYTGTSTPGTARSVLWIDTSNILHFRGAHTAGFRVESSAGTVALSVGNAGSIAIGAATPTANQGDLSVGRGVNVGSGVVGAINGQVKALSGYFGGDLEITGQLIAPNYTITAVDVLMVGGPTGATSGQIAANQLIAQPDGANPVPSGYVQQFGSVIAGLSPNFASYDSSMKTVVGTGSAGDRGSSLLLYANPVTPNPGYHSGVYFAMKPTNGVGDLVYGAVIGVATASAGSGFHTPGALSFFVRGLYTDANLTEMMRLNNYGLGIGRTPLGSGAGSLAVNGPFVGTSGQFTTTLQVDGVLTANAGALIGPTNHRGVIGQGSLYIADFVSSLTTHGVRSWVTANSALYLYEGATPSGQRFLVWANGDMWLERGLNVGTAGAARPAVSGEIVNTGPMDWTYQGSPPATPNAGHLKWWFDTRGSGKITRPSGEQWFVDIKENHFYNSDFDVWQRGTTFTGITSSQYTADRWYASINVGTFTISRAANSVPLTAATQGGHYVPFVFRAQSTVVVADGSILSSSLAGFRYSWEGRFWQRLVGRPTVFSCWVRSDRTLLYSIAFRSGNFGRYFVQTFTIAAANTWQYVWFVIPVPPVLTDFNYDHTLGAEAWFIVAAGTASKGATVNAWTAGALLASSSQGNMLNTLNSYLEIAHVKIESGEVPTPCIGRPWDDDLRHAQRYFVKTFAYDTAPASNAGAAGALNAIMTNGSGAVSWRFPVAMRTTPTTISTYNPTSSGSNWNSSVVASIADQSADGLTIVGTLAAANGIRPEIHAAAHADF